MKRIIQTVWIALLLAGISFPCLAAYTASPTSTTNGGGTWGSILRMSASISGTQATFTISKQSGTFTSASTMYLTEGSSTGTVRGSKSVATGASSVSISITLSGTTSRNYYARYDNTQGGSAWVGPITVSFTNSAPGAPTISSSPTSARVGVAVGIAVTRGTDANGDRVKVQCTAANSNWSSPAYDSGLDTGGTTVTPSFTFSTSGTKTIYCTSFDEYGAGSSTSNRAISVVANTAPTAPVISSSPTSARVGVAVGISVTKGTDANGDRVKVQCTAADSNWNSPAYDSGLGTGGVTVTPSFTFSAAGTKTIYCTSFDEFGAGSSTSNRTISVTANTAPTAPVISSSPATATVNTPVSISVTKGTDANGDRVKVQCSAIDSNWSNPAYDSGLGTGGATVTPSFTFSASGTKTIYCTSFDEFGAGSSTSNRTIQVSSSTPTGSLTSPTGTVTGPVTVTASVNAPTGMQKVSVVFALNGTPYVLCEDGTAEACPATTGNWSKPNIDPRWYSATAGSLPVGLWVKSDQGVSTLVSDRTITWQPAATGTLTSPSGSGAGNITVAGNVTASAGLRKVSVVFVANGTPLVLCEDYTANPCPAGTTFSFNKTNVNPSDYSVTGAASLTLGLWMADDLGRVENVHRQSFQWTPGASGTLTSPTGSNVGPVTVTASVNVPSGLRKVSVVFIPHGTPFVLCQDGTADPCPATTGSWSKPGIDPRWYSATAGSLPVGLWVGNDQGVDTLVSDRTITWQPAATGTLTAPSGSGAGTITVAGSVTASAGLRKVSVVFVQNGTPLVLCEDNTANPCPAGTTFSFNKADVLPRDYSVTGSASLNIGLWMADDLGRIENVDRKDFQWSPAGSGSFTSPSGSVTGPVRIAASATAPQGLRKVSVVFVPGGPSFVLCEDGTATACPAITNGTWDRTGIDPRAYGITAAGPVVLGLWIRDDLGRTDRVATQSFQWTPSTQPAYLNVSDWAQAAAHFLVTRGIVTDPANHDLRGTSDVNRAELATMIYRALGGGSTADTSFASWYGGDPTPRFVDVVDPTVWYFKPVSYLGGLAFGDGITVFDQQVGIFRPANPISKAWAVKALLEAWDIRPLTSFSGVTLFSDVPTSHPAAGYIYQAKQKGLVTGTNNLFEPDVLVDRQDIFVMLHRVLDAQANASSLTIPSPAPLSRDDFAAARPLRRIGVQYEQPVLWGVQTPTVSVTATALARETVGSLAGIYTSTLDATLSGVDSRSFVDSRGITRVAHPFCSWSATSGSFVDLTPAGAVPFSRVRWLAPADVSAAAGNAASFEVTVYCGDDLGNEVRATRTLSLTSQSDDATLPTISLSPLPTGKIGGQLVEIQGAAQDGGNVNDADYGILRVEFFFSSDAGATWTPLGEAALDSEGEWRFSWLLPPLMGTLQVQARATNLRGNTAQAQRSLTVTATLALEGSVVDGRGRPLENVLVILTGGGLDTSLAADGDGAFRFSNATGIDLATGVAYTLTASLDGKSATASGLMLASQTGTLHRILILDMAPPTTAASAPGGTYATPPSVELVCIDDHSECAATYYTLDGTTPGTSSALYTGPILVAVDTTLRFFSVDGAGNQEEVVTETYVFASCSFAIDPASQSFGASGGDGSVTVTGPGGCAWTAASDASWIAITSGTSGDGNGLVTFSVEPNLQSIPRAATLSIADQTFAVSQGGAGASTGLDFYTVLPCRLVDTRFTTPLTSGFGGIVELTGACGIPGSAKVLSVNVTAIGATGPGYIVLWPSDLPKPGTSVINFVAQSARSNNAILPLATDASGSIGAEAYVEGGGTVHLIIDVNGYFE